MAAPRDKHQRILDAALKVFAAKGFYNTKVSEIARTAGVADGTIYNYFKSKDDILISLFEDQMDWILARLETLDGDIVQQITGYIALHLAIAVENPDLAEFITVELRQSEKFLREYENPKFSQYLRTLSSLIEEGRVQGVFREGIDARLVARAIFGALDELMLTLTLSQKSRPIDAAAVAAQVAELFLSGLKA